MVEGRLHKMSKIKLTKQQIFDLEVKYSHLWKDWFFNSNSSEEKFTDERFWTILSNKVGLDEDFIRDFKDFLNWHSICNVNRLTEDFIREFQDYVDWKAISYGQCLSEDFVKEFKDKLDWEAIYFCQKLSDDFIIEMHKEGYIK